MVGSSNFDTDVLILGGGPAGLAAALAARQRGFRVVVADAEQPPIDKPCGEGLMPDSLAAAARLGVNIPSELGHTFKGIRFVSGAHHVSAQFPERSGLGVRRTVLQHHMAQAASRVGVDLRWKTRFTSLSGNTAHFTSDAITARWIIGADGGQSIVRHWMGLDNFVRNSTRFGFRRHFRIQPWSPFVEIHWSRGCQIYITPVAAGEVCVVLMSRDPHLRLAQALPQFPLLAARLNSSLAATPEQGAHAATRILSRVARANYALIGDASGTVDPITGEGLCLAFEQAKVLVEALAKNDLDHYNQSHAKLAFRPRFMADFMLSMDLTPAIRNHIMQTLSRHPQFFERMLSMHVGRLTWPQFAQTLLKLAAASAMLP